MKRIVIFLISLALLTGCATATTNPLSTPSLDMPQKPTTSLDDNAPTGSIPHTYAPLPSDDQLKRGPAYVESVALLSMESNPVQYSITLKGNLPTPCNKLRMVYQEPDSQHRINLEVYSVTDPAKMCAEVLQPFEQNVSLGSFPTGHYTVWVNGKQMAEFDA